LLLIEPGEVATRRAESARLRKHLRGSGKSLDLIVVGKDEFESWCSVSASFYAHVKSTGRVIVAPDADATAES